MTGTSASGQPIVSRGGDAYMDMHRQMHGRGCATCYGVNREGRRLMPRFWVKAPALTAGALFGKEDGQGHESDGHGNHESYDQSTLRRAIADGIDPAGESLDEAVPRWSMSAANLNDLIQYLQQPNEHSHSG